ncbi:hypothetical protein FHS85_004801 [Rhodoligotrophos appendicifer]|uniref:hypothetical protein n=1 Tax=Rhodoligotrophos appendicifer TaxID=987056 RepID=UPI0011861BA7|nr:hypothetical protein [Rhodoligotrophos appendicifer]
MDRFEPEWFEADGGVQRYDKLASMLEREGRAMSSLATRMRMTQQATMKAETAGVKARYEPGDRPWDYTGLDGTHEDP